MKLDFTRNVIEYRKLLDNEIDELRIIIKTELDKK